MKNIEDKTLNVGEGKTEEKNENLLDLFKGSFIFPLMTIVTRISPLVFIDPINPVAYWLIAGTIVDVAEVGYRIYGTDELDKLGTSEEEYKPFSCFEKHLFYDLPKYLDKKIRGKNNLTTSSEFPT